MNRFRVFIIIFLTIGCCSVGLRAQNSWPSDLPRILIDFEDFELQNVGDVHEGIFSLSINGRSNTYRFYRVKDATQVGKSEWYTIQNPRFDHGVCAVRSCVPNNGQYRWYILKANGDSIPLDPNIKKITNFYDGLALVSSGPSNEMYYINDKGQRVYPHIKPYKYDFKNYPLTEGNRRLFRSENGKFGYMDANGKVVIEPKYQSARNFSGGHAIVHYDYSSNWWVINMLGEKVSEIPRKYNSFSGVSITSFINSSAMAYNDETEQVDIVSPLMQVKASYDNASGFFLKTVPSDAAIAIVKNRDWEHPKFCTTTGELVKDQEYPYGPYTKHQLTDPILHEMDCQEDPSNFDNRIGWHNTGFYASHHTLIGDTDVVYNYKGVVWEYNNNSTKVREFSEEGYSPGIKYILASPHELGLTGEKSQKREPHYVFYNSEGQILLEFVIPEEKKD